MISLQTYLITEDQSNFATVKDGGVESKSLVGYDENRGGASAAMLRHKASQRFVNLLFGARVDGEGVDPAS